MRDMLELFIYVILPIVILIIIAVIVGNEYNRYTCSNYEKITNKKTRYVNFDSCYVKTKQGYQQWDEYKSRIIASEGLKDK